MPKPKPFTLPANLPPPLTVEETARFYDVSPPELAEIQKHVTKFIITTTADPREVKPYWVTFDDMTWPGLRLGALEWKLRHGAPSKKDIMAAASVVHAYNELVNEAPETKRRKVIRAIRSVVAQLRKHAPNEPI